MTNEFPAYPTIDLVLATVGRTAEVARFLEALARQTYRHFHLIVVDQNEDDRLLPLLKPYERELSITRVVSSPGLSRARNIGMSHLNGDVVAFPDDDCHYPPEALAIAAKLLSTHPDWDGVTGRAVDEAGYPSSGRWDPSGGEIGRYNVWRRALSITIFLRRHVIDTVGLYDETLGVGSGTPYGSGEETDYLLRAIGARFALHYCPALTVIHPDNREEPSAEAIAAGQRYGAGMGRVLRKHDYPLWYCYYHVGRALGGALIALPKRRPAEARFHWAVARGRMQGLHLNAKKGT